MQLEGPAVTDGEIRRTGLIFSMKAGNITSLTIPVCTDVHPYKPPRTQKALPDGWQKSEL
jgi:hypothetical protein